MNRTTMIVLVVIVFLVLAVGVSKAKPLPVVAKEEFDRYGGDIKRLAQKYGVPASRIAAMILVESHLDISAEGTSGERGLMQLKQGALSDVNATYGTLFTWQDMFSPLKNIEAGAAYLAIQYGRCGSINDATQSYNAGFAAFKANAVKGRDYLRKVLKTEETLQLLY